MWADGISQGVINTSLLIVAITTIVGALVVVWRYSRKVNHFLDDWFGEPERQGQARRPGVMERLHVVEQNTAMARDELRYNGGHSLKDAVRRVETTVEEIKTEVRNNA